MIRILAHLALDLRLRDDGALALAQAHPMAVACKTTVAENMKHP